MSLGKQAKILTTRQQDIVLKHIDRPAIRAEIGSFFYLASKRGFAQKKIIAMI